MRQSGEEAQDAALTEALRLVHARWTGAEDAAALSDAEAQAFAALRATLGDLCARSAARLRWPGEDVPAIAQSAPVGRAAPDRLWASHPLGPDHTLDLGDPHFFLCLDGDGLEIGLICRTEDAAVREHRVQRMLKRRMPAVFRSVRRVLKTPRLRGAPDARWSLRWRQALDAPRERAPDVNQWLAQQVNKTDHRRLCLTCFHPFDEVAETDVARATRDALDALLPLIAPALRPEGAAVAAEAADAAADATATPAQRAQESDFAALLAAGAPPEALRDWGARALAAAGQEGLSLVPQADGEDALWLWIDDGAARPENHPGYCGLHLDVRSGRVGLTLYQGIGYGVSRFGGRGSVAEMQRRRAGLLPQFQSLEDAGFAFDSRLHQVGETAHQTLHEAALTAWSEVEAAEADAPDLATRLAAMLAARAAVSRSVAGF